MQAQAAVAAHEEFSGTLGFVGTRRCYDDEPQDNGGYHFYGNAENVFGIGSAMGQAMLELLDLDDG